MMNCVTDIYKLVGLISLCSCSQNIMASPWIEADDPFLRSDVIALSDAGSLNSSVSVFPLPWSATSELVFNSDDTFLIYEREHVLYQRSSAQYNRGNRLFSVSACSRCSANSYAWQSDESKSVQVSYEHASNQFAFRVSSKASYKQNDFDINWDNSYIALNGAGGVISLGYLARWWGPTWYHNLVLDTSSEELGLNVNFFGQNSILGYWSFNSLLADTVDSEFKYRWSNRLQSKPISWLEYGLTQYSWFDTVKNDYQEKHQKMSVDMRVTLPNWGEVPFSHSVYAEVASFENTDSFDAHILGWSGHFPFQGNSLRLALESQQLETSEQCVRNKCERSNSGSQLYRDSLSISAYLQLRNDHQISIILSKQYHGLYGNEQKARLGYVLPLLSGRLELSGSYSSLYDQSFWSRYEFRF